MFYERDWTLISQVKLTIRGYDGTDRKSVV